VAGVRNEIAPLKKSAPNTPGLTEKLGKNFEKKIFAPGRVRTSDLKVISSTL
jgi:hypothetical protein